MSAQSYIKLWTAEPSEHEDVQTYDLLEYEYDFSQDADKTGRVIGNMQGGKIGIIISGFPTDDLLAWMLSPQIHKNGELMNSSGILGSQKEVIRFRGAQCLEMNVHSTTKECRTKLLIHFKEMETGDSCYLNM